MNEFSDPIYIWYTGNKRDLPWRKTTDPYKIWLSEIILQQTRVAQGLEYFDRFVENFPTISDLASSSEDEVLKLWQGLGYYSRARNLHFTAQYIQKKYNGIFPSDYLSILNLKGVGEYTASAIASIAFNLPYAVVDGNVFRLLSRYFGIEDPIDSSEGKKKFRTLASELIDKSNPGLYNQAVMEFGALQCVPVNPDCDNCPLVYSCYAFINKKVAALPVKKGKTKIRNRFFNYFVLYTDDSVFLKKRTANDIWKNLFEFPLVETENQEAADSAISMFSTFFCKTAKMLHIQTVSGWKVHLLSHQRIYYRFIELYTENEKEITSTLIKVSKKDIFNFAVPKLLENFINKSGLF